MYLPKEVIEIQGGSMTDQSIWNQSHVTLGPWGILGAGRSPNVAQPRLLDGCESQCFVHHTGALNWMALVIVSVGESRRWLD